MGKKMIRTTAAAIAMATMLAACSGKEEAAAPAPKPTPQGRFEVQSSMPTTQDPEQKRQENQEIMDHMMADMNVPSDNIPGEAFRRGITIDPAALQARIAREKAAGGATRPSTTDDREAN